jgi:hypothetical protein
MASYGVARREADVSTSNMGEAWVCPPGCEVQTQGLNERVYRGVNKDETGGGQEEAAMRSTAKLR